MERVVRLLLVSILLFAARVAPVLAEPREILSLDGVWRFATDPKEQGEAEKWFLPAAALPKMPLAGYAAEADGKIRVPGIWDNQGYGVENEKVRHNFVGKGWYKRNVEIPGNWAGRHVFLNIGGVSRYAKIWINGNFVGEHIGYSSPMEYDVTKLVSPGKTASVTIQVDSKQRYTIDALLGAAAFVDYMDIPWGGIWGHVSLESRGDAWLDELQVQTDIGNSSCTATAKLNGAPAAADGVRLEVLDGVGQVVAQSTSALDGKIAVGGAVAVKTTVPNAKLWTPDSPTLYKARLVLLKDGKVVDLTESRFGMRQFKVDGPHLLLNGRRIMLCGYGDDHIYPEQMAMPCDKELHLARLRTIRSYGFNHVRHHSTMMPPEYYDACDEVGMIATAEFPIVYSNFLPGTGETWKAKVPKGTSPDAANETYKREWAAAIKRYRNHPSIVCWVMGNELWEGVPLRHEFQRIARELDPGRFFADTDGIWAKYVFADKKDRDTLDLHFILFDCFTNVLDNPAKFKTPKPVKPVISHEAGNYITFSRPDLGDQFKHNIKPFWLTAGRAKLEKLGLLKEAEQWAEKSERLYLALHKHNIEAIRKNPYLSGYHWWLFQDYWTTANGIVDHYFRPKSITKEDVLRFNSPVVVLQDGLDRTYRAGNQLNIKLLVSNFSSGPLDGVLTWEVKAGEQSVARRQVKLESVPQGDVSQAAQIELKLPEIASPSKLKITAEVIDGDGKRFANDWTAWLYPSEIRPAELLGPVFADKTQIGQLQKWGVRPLPAKGELDAHAAYIVSWPCDSRVVDAMKRGACVVVLDGAQHALKSYPVTFRTSWWKGGDTPQTNNTGTFVYDHPVTRAVAPDGWCDEGWFYLVDGANKFVLDDKPARADVVVRALPSMVSVEDQALLFEVGVDRGSLIVSGLNHRKARGRPENEWLTARLIERAVRLPKPAGKWPAASLKVGQ